MSLFSKKRLDEIAAKEFWDWFEENESWIIECIKKPEPSFIWEIDKKLKLVFPYYKNNLEFLLGFTDGKGEFFFYHFGKKSLIKDSLKLKSMMTDNIASRWQFILEK